jgi:hypothetical protein
VRAVATGWCLAALASLAACDGDSHIYSAQPYDSTRDCVDRRVAIDVISGGTSSYDCAPECLVYSAPDASPNAPQRIYVSNQCGPYPQGLRAESQGDVTSASDPCGPAIAAFLDQTIRDGGVCPQTSRDAGEAGAPDGSAVEAGAPGDAGAPSD